jgi:hypothetical protein
MQNFKLSADKNSTKTQGGPDTEILQVKYNGTGKYEIDKLLPHSLSIRRVQGKLQQLKL